jgi:flavin reductase (DIM6/NTAB) family NADH-FMN oxidoreductase RutF
MNKEKIGAFPFIFPIPIALAGALVDGRPNFTEVGDVGIMGIKPPFVYVSLGETSHTCKGIKERGTYSLNFPNTQMMAEADYCGIVSGQAADKARLFKVFTDPDGLPELPMIEACPINLACEVVHHFTLEHRNIFVGRVAACYVSRKYLTIVDGRKKLSDLTALDPLMYGLDNHYYRIGPKIGQGYQEGQRFKEDPEPVSNHS